MNSSPINEECFGQGQGIHIDEGRLQAGACDPPDLPLQQLFLARHNEHPRPLPLCRTEGHAIHDDVLDLEGNVALRLKRQGLAQLGGLHRGHLDHTHDDLLSAHGEVHASNGQLERIDGRLHDGRIGLLAGSQRHQAPSCKPRDLPAL